MSLGSQYSREERERVNVVGLSMPLPLFDRNQGNVLAAARRADQARDLRNAVQLRLHSDTRSAVSQWASAMQEVQAYDRTILPSAQQAVDTATRGFEMGKFAFLDVLDAQRTLIEARGLYTGPGLGNRCPCSGRAHLRRPWPRPLTEACLARLHRCHRQSL